MVRRGDERGFVIGVCGAESMMVDDSKVAVDGGEDIGFRFTRTFDFDKGEEASGVGSWNCGGECVFCFVELAFFNPWRLFLGLSLSKRDFLALAFRRRAGATDLSRSR